MTEPTGAADEPRCDRCGSLSPRAFGDRLVCEDCYALCGSCCLEFGADDLWDGEGD